MRLNLEAPYEAPDPTDGHEARAWLRQQFSCWPFVTDEFRAFLNSLDWRRRATLCQIYGERRKLDDAAYFLGYSITTLKQDVADVCGMIASLEGKLPG